MEIQGFNKDELIILENLPQTSKNVNNAFERLYTLEISELKNTTIYNQAFLELTKAINIENETYQQLNLSPTDLYKFIQLLSNQTKLPIFDIKPTTSYANYNNKSIKRVINFLTSLMMNHPDYHKQILNDSLSKEILSLNIIKQQDDLINGFTNSIKIESSLHTDIHCLFLSFLEDEILKQTNNNIKKNLIKAKYCFAITNKDLEPFLIETKINIPKTIFINSKIITQLLKTPEHTYSFIKLSQLKTQAKIEINKLLKLKDNEYNNPDTQINSIISSCYLRALLSLMTDEELHTLNEEFKNQIENPKYTQEHLYDRISENIIISCFKCNQFDKSKTRILSIN